MRYIPATDNDRKEMLQKIGAKDINELFSVIPEELQLKKPLNLPEPMGEMEVTALLQNLAKEGEEAGARISFLGGGVNRHFIPSVIPALIGRGEFLTAYTPYQPEASQGTLQALYEFQTYIALLSGMDVANASLYDGATALAEATLMAKRISKKGNTVYVSRAVHPNYRAVLQTYLRDIEVPIVELPFDIDTGKTILDAEKITDALAIIIGYPNYFGVIEDLKQAKEVATKVGAVLISVTTEALALALLKPPGEFGVDIFVGEGQSFGMAPSFGGPFLGLIAVKEAHYRNLPGRLIGKGKDKEGKEAYLIVVSTREQHIKREKATSNICTNQALCATTASMYLTLYGKEGLRSLARLNLEKAFYLRSILPHHPEISLQFNGHVFNEFVIRTNKLGDYVVRTLRNKYGIYGGIALGEKYPELQNAILVSVTEMNSKEEMIQLARALREVTQ